MPLILGTNSIKDTGFNVSNSLRLSYADDPHLNHETGTATNTDKATLSFWVKRSANLGDGQGVFAEDTDGSNKFVLLFGGDDQIDVFQETAGTVDINLVTNREFRDVAAWMHVVLAYDSSQGTAANRVKLYINGVQETSFSTAVYPASNVDFRYNKNSITQEIGRYEGGNSFDGYLSEIVFIDGLQLAPDQFGEFDSDSAIWKPKDVSGLTFGNSGFYLQFKESGTSANSSGIGADTSGNTSHFTVTNLAATDQSTDTCTNNFATLNPLIEFYPSYTSTFSEGNLDITRSDNGGGLATIMPTQGKWYAEFKFITVGSGTNAIGVLPYDKITDNEFNVENKGVAYLSSGQKKVDGSASDYGNTYGANDIISIAINLDDGEAVFYKNGTAQNSGNAISGFTNDGVMAISCKGGGSAWKWSSNFGSPPFAISSGNTDGSGFGNFEYAVPSGYFALCTKNLAEYG